VQRALALSTMLQMQMQEQAAEASLAAAVAPSAPLLQLVQPATEGGAGAQPQPQPQPQPPTAVQSSENPSPDSLAAQELAQMQQVELAKLAAGKGRATNKKIKYVLEPAGVWVRIPPQTMLVPSPKHKYAERKPGLTEKYVSCEILVGVTMTRSRSLACVISLASI
jgi:hypothetical protein